MPPAETPRGNSRSDSSWLLLVAGVLLLARIAYGVWHSANPGAAHDQVRWVSAENAVAESRRTGKPILYDFNAAWCPPCQAMKRELFGDEQQARSVEERVIPVSVVDRSREDGHNTALIDSLQRVYAIDSFPTLVVVSPETGRSQQQAGYGGAPPTVQWIARAATSVKVGGLLR